jgi:hypothetical protein
MSIVHLLKTRGGVECGEVGPSVDTHPPSNADINFVTCEECLRSHDERQPPRGSWADVARMMAQGDDSGFDWDAWKDEMKETDGQGY